VAVGAYVPGVNFENDLAVRSRPKILEFLQQDAARCFAREQTAVDLDNLYAAIGELERQIRSGNPQPVERT
jgi:flagellar biosynthesis/type III secretory pathway ATPase